MDGGVVPPARLPPARGDIASGRGGGSTAVRVRDHILISTVGAVLAAPFIGRGAVSLWAGGVFIDADHYVWFCLRQRRLSLPAAVHFFSEAGPPQHPATCALHAPAALVFVFLLALRQRRLLPV